MEPRMRLQSTKWFTRCWFATATSDVQLNKECVKRAGSTDVLHRSKTVCDQCITMTKVDCII